jgi:hypothetical protein
MMVDEMGLLAKMRSELPESLLATDGAERRFLEKVSASHIDPGVKRFPGRDRRASLRASAPIGSVISWGAGIAGSVTLVVVVFALLGAFRSSSETSEPSSGSRLHVSRGVGVLHVAAQEAAAITPRPEPRATQWIYFRMVQVSDGKRSSSTNWMRFDGGAAAYFQDGKLVTHPSPFGPPSLRGSHPLTVYARTGIPMSAYAALSSLRRSPSGVLRDVRRVLTRNHRVKPRLLAQKEFHFLVTLLWTGALVPTRAQANVFDALAHLPGITVLPNQTDAAGQAAVAISSGGLDKVQLMLDPRSYRVLGIRTIMPKPIRARSPRASRKPPVPPRSESRGTQGTVTSSIALSQTTLVANPGEH